MKKFKEFISESTDNRTLATQKKVTKNFVQGLSVGSITDFYMQSNGDKVEGKVTKINSSSVTFKPRGGPAQTFTIIA